MKLQIEHEKASLEKQRQELEWVKKAAELASDLDREHSSTISIDDEYAVIGGIMPKREKEPA